MTDTPVTPTNPPVPRSERIKAFIGDLARPLALLSLGLSTSAAVIITALKVENGNDGAILIGAAGIIVGGMYGFKEWGNVKAAQAGTTS